MNNLEEIVQMALESFDRTSIDGRDRNHFELEFRRLLMQKYSTTSTVTYTYGTGGAYSKQILNG